MQVQALKATIQKKDDQIQLLRLILRAIHEFKEKKSLNNESRELEQLEDELFNL